MASIAVLVIQETKGGVSIDQIPIQNGTKLERQISLVLDLELAASQQYVMQKISVAGGAEAIQIEGEDIEKHVSGALKQMDAVNWRKLLDEAGFKLP